MANTGKKINKLRNDKRRKYAIEISKLASKANKRLKRLELQNLTSSPAYQKFLQLGVNKFSVKNKDYNQLQSEKMKLLNFLNSQTSTIRGLNKSLRTLSSSTGLKNQSVLQLHTKAKTFFAIAQKIEEYLDNVEGSALTIGYEKIWEVVAKYVNDSQDSMSDFDVDITKMIDEIHKLNDINKLPSPFDMMRFNIDKFK